MSYKDKGKQKEAVRDAQRRRRVLHKGDVIPQENVIPVGVGITSEDITKSENVIPESKGITSVYKGVTLSRPVDLNKAPDPDDALDPRNYSEAYLGAMCAQGHVLTEDSRVAMATIGWMKGVDPVRLQVFQSRYHLSSDREFKGRKKVAKA